MHIDKKIFFICVFFFFYLIIFLLKYQKKQICHHNQYDMLEQFDDVIIAEYDILQDKLTFLPQSQRMLLLDQLSYCHFSQNYKETNIVLPDDWRVIENLFVNLSDEEVYKCEVRMQFHDGVYKWCMLDMLVKQRYHQPYKIICKITDISQHKAKLESLEAKAIRDAMTGLYQKNTFQEKVSKLIEYNVKGCFLILDLDNFKEINDTYGHDVGDQCLVEFGRILKSCFRKEDIISRYGGDEFEVFMMNIIDAGIVEKKACQIMQALQLSKVFEDLNITPTCSIGAFIVDRYTPYLEAFERADLALYCSKYQGKNQCRIDCSPNKKLYQ